MALFLGIDGGGTSTSCLLADEHSVLGEGKSGPSNIFRVGETTARQSLISTIQQACATAQIDPFQIQRTCIGIAGAARPEVAAKVRKILEEVISGEIEVVGDMVIALHAAFGTGPGIVVIAGTGSIAYGRKADGETARTGGWGPAISDEGSGFWIGRTAVSSVMRSADEGNASKNPLLHNILKAWNLKNIEELVLAPDSSHDFAALFPAVLATAASGDETSAQILRRAGTELASLARILVSRLFSNTEEVPVAVAGGVFENSALIREIFYNELRGDNERLMMADKICKPVYGALDRARQPLP